MSLKETPAFLPKEIIVGYRQRENTLDGKLAFATAKSEKGNLFSEISFNSWCDKKIPKDIFPNTAQDGFIINKSRNKFSSYGSEALRVFHPAGFEFEITVSNLSYIHCHSDTSKGQIIEQCIMGWKGGKHILIPINSELYRVSEKLVDAQNKPLKGKIVVGKTYITTQAQDVIYLGNLPFFEKLVSLKSVSKKNHRSKKSLFDLKKSACSYNEKIIVIDPEPTKREIYYSSKDNSFLALNKNHIKFEKNEPIISLQETNELIDSWQESFEGSKTVILYKDNAEEVVDSIYRQILDNILTCCDRLSFLHSTPLGFLKDSPTLKHAQFKPGIENHEEIDKIFKHLFGVNNRYRSFRSDNCIMLLILLKVAERGLFNPIDKVKVKEEDFQNLFNKLNTYSIESYFQDDYFIYSSDDSSDDCSNSININNLNIFNLEMLESFLDNVVNVLKMPSPEDVVANFPQQGVRQLYLYENNHLTIHEKCKEFFECNREYAIKSINEKFTSVFISNEKETFELEFKD